MLAPRWSSHGRHQVATPQLAIDYDQRNAIVVGIAMGAVIP